jgi:hypothetical protein
MRCKAPLDLSCFLELLGVEAEKSRVEAEVVAWHKTHSLDHIIQLSQNLLAAVDALFSRLLEEVRTLLDASLEVINCIRMQLSELNT